MPGDGCDLAARRYAGVIVTTSRWARCSVNDAEPFAGTSQRTHKQDGECCKQAITLNTLWGFLRGIGRRAELGGVIAVSIAKVNPIAVRKIFGGLLFQPSRSHRQRRYLPVGEVRDAVAHQRAGVRCTVVRDRQIPVRSHDLNVEIH